MAAIKADARRMYILSWNDIGEDHDIWPSANKGTCLLDIFTFYNQWFKERKEPVFASDKVILSYPMRIPDKVTTQPANWGGGEWVSPAYAPKIFYWAYLTAPKTLEIAGVGKVDLPAGLSMGKIGTIPESLPSAVTLEAVWNGRKITLPSVQRTKVEQQHKDEGGLEFRYVDLTSNVATAK